MVNSIRCATMLITGALSFCGYELGKMKAVEEQVMFSIPNFSTISKQEGNTAANLFVDNLHTLGDDIVKQLQDVKTSPEGRLFAIYLSGELRDSRACTHLIKYIDFKAPFRDPALRIARWGTYPSQEALTKIGVHGVQLVLLAIGDEVDKTRLGLLVDVIRDIYGDQIAKVIIREAAAKAEKKENMLKALEMLEGKKGN